MMTETSSTKAQQLVKGWRVPVVLLCSEPTRALFHDAMERCAPHWPQCIWVFCPLADEFVMCSFSCGERHSLPSSMTNERDELGASSVGHAANAFHYLCARASVFNEVDVKSCRQVNPLSRVLCVDLWDRTDQVRLQKWREMQGSSLMYVFVMREGGGSRDSVSSVLEEGATTISHLKWIC